MALDVKVKIDLIKPVASLDWGYPLIVGEAEKAVPYTECATLADVVEAGFASGTDVYAAAAKMCDQLNPPQKFAVCGLTTVDATTLAALSGAGWRQLVLAGDIAASVGATYIETTEKMFFAACASATDAAAFKDKKRVFAVVHSTESVLAAAAVAGEVAGHEVGSITYKNLIIKGITPEVLTENELKAIHDANAVTILEKAGDVVTSEGTVANGEYADIIDGTDYVIQQITYKVQKLLNTLGKLPFDNRGIAMAEGVVVSVLQSCYNKGLIAEDEEGNPLYTVSFAARTEVDAGDIAARKYLGGKFAFTLAGAIHEAEITGEIAVA